MLVEPNGLGGREVAGLVVTAEQLRADVNALVSCKWRLDRDVLASIDIDLDEVRRCAEEAFGPGSLERRRTRGRYCRHPFRAGSIPLTPRAEKVLELAFCESLSLGHTRTSAESTS